MTHKSAPKAKVNDVSDVPQPTMSDLKTFEDMIGMPQEIRAEFEADVKAEGGIAPEAE